MANMQGSLFFDPNLTIADRMLLANLAGDCDRHQRKKAAPDLSQVDFADGNLSGGSHTQKQSRADSLSPEDASALNENTIQALKALNSPDSEQFEPTVFCSVDFNAIKIPAWLLHPYVKWARKIVRVETDVVMLNHLILYFTTSVPSAIYLFCNFHWWHAIMHAIMTGWFIGTYTLMMHQHIHTNGILAKKFWWFDLSFPYITDPLMGHTWNTYFYHHVKHHHVEGNGPDDLSSTIRYQRDNVWHFLHYVGRFYFLVWFDLPRYFLRKRKPVLALKAAFFELSNYTTIYLLATRVNFHATLFVFLIPLLAVRVGLMVGNWGQHAFVDEVDPTSDFRSSITLIDVPSNRFCYNDGYHTSHHLNPRRHWRDHPVAFLAQKHQYADEHALVFHNIDFIMITVKLLQKDYTHLAKCLVPMGSQLDLTLEQRAIMLRSKTRAFSEQEIEAKFGKSKMPGKKTT